MHGIKLLSWLIAMLALCLAASAQARPGRHAAPSKPARIIAISDDERDMLEDIAYANLGEIALGKLAIGKTMSLAVRSFAQRMIDDHSRAQSALEKLAKARGVSLPGDIDMQRQTIAIGLRGLAGGAFDEQYLKRAGIDEHERFIDLLQQVGEEAQDRDLRVYADRTLRLVGRHLSMAGELDDADDGASAGEGKGGD